MAAYVLLTKWTQQGIADVKGAPERIKAVRQMILSDSEEQRRAQLAKLEPMQREDFVGIFRAMAGMPVTIRFLDPPLHEFLPHTEEELRAIAGDLGVSFEQLSRKNESLHSGTGAAVSESPIRKSMRCRRAPCCRRLAMLLPPAGR